MHIVACKYNLCHDVTHVSVVFVVVFLFFTPLPVKATEWFVTQLLFVPRYYFTQHKSFSTLGQLKERH